MNITNHIDFLGRKWGNTTLFLKRNWHIPSPVHIYTLFWQLSKRFYVNLIDQGTDHHVERNTLWERTLGYPRLGDPGKRMLWPMWAPRGWRPKHRRKQPRVGFTALEPCSFWSSSVPPWAKLRHPGVCAGQRNECDRALHGSVIPLWDKTIRLKTAS